MTNKLPYIKMFKAALITGCFFLYSCHNDYQQVQDLAKKTIPTDKATDVTSYFSQGGITKAKLTTPLMTMAQGDTPKTEFPKTLHVDFYDSVKLQSKLFAKYGLYYPNKHLVFLRDSVVVFNVQGDTLRSEELWWDQDKEIIYTSLPVHIRKPDEKLDGDSMTADQNFNHYTIFNARGPINVPDSTLPAN
ncbi:LPS export ABC transporter periplasmic protein LptC [Parafilimonas terrae]|jgi:LPS export ABC transporter protein LptC|nr:LPS export ABC transporter periplasmic protein LptC [Parafilimonas terrae]